MLFSPLHSYNHQKNRQQPRRGTVHAPERRAVCDKPTEKGAKQLLTTLLMVTNIF